MGPEILKSFYLAILQSTIAFGISCWGGNITSGDKEKIDRTIKKAEKLLGTELLFVDELFNDLSLTKAKNIIKDPSHPLYNEYTISKRSNRIIMPKVNTERYRLSFVPSTSKRLSSQSRLVNWNTNK